jgi:hypothetical protein
VAVTVNRLRTYLAKVLVALMLWIGVAGPLAVVHARAVDAPQNAITELKQQALHIEEHAVRGHHGGVGHSQDSAQVHGKTPLKDPACVKFCAELMDTPGVISFAVDRKPDVGAHSPAIDLIALFPSDVFTGSAISKNATGPPFGQRPRTQNGSGLQALLALNHRLRI